MCPGKESGVELRRRSLVRRWCRREERGRIKEEIRVYVIVELSVLPEGQIQREQVWLYCAELKDGRGGRVE